MTLKPEERSRLLDAARSMLPRAYAPYSRFPVGAALLTGDGEIVTGCNVENSSFGLAICAERNALAAAVARGHRRIRAVAVVSEAPHPVAPCGACRQVLAEFNPDMIVLSEGQKGDVQQWTLRDLLPHGFTGGDIQAAHEGRAAPRRSS
ncbi:MAG: cytidine deaminase [Candidatus Sumerlaeia bacterium]